DGAAPAWKAERVRRARIGRPRRAQLRVPDLRAIVRRVHAAPPRSVVGRSPQPGCLAPLHGGACESMIATAGGPVASHDWRRELAAVLVAAVALTVLYTYPVAFKPGRVGRVDNGDGELSIWNVTWVARTLA